MWSRSAEEFVELIVRTDPDPFDGVTLPATDHTEVKRDPDRPIIGTATEFFELKGVMPWVAREQTKYAACRLLLVFGETAIRPPKRRRCP